MIMRALIGCFTAMGLLLATAGHAADTDWKQGEHYFLINPAQKMNPANELEVTEAFSYGCPACNQFYPLMEKLIASLPPGTKVEYLPASFIPAESWPLFQRAYCTAQKLGVVEKTHGEMFHAIWGPGELATFDFVDQRLKDPPPRIENVAKFYNRVAGVDTQKFLETARSSGVESCMQRSDRMMETYKVDSTPTIIVNGKYRATPTSAGSYGLLVELVQWLVAREAKAAQ